MNLDELLRDLNEAVAEGAVADDSKIVALVRNVDIEPSADDAWSEVPLADLELEVDECNFLRLDAEHQEQLTVAGLRSRIEALPREASRYYVCVNGELTELSNGWSAIAHVPVVASVRNPELRLFGVMPRYDGCDEELEIE